mmetsp:Transcript_16369/g.39172  ORF Transcript_16369/g.39172 Transcript_16369/m.39172 type:complete len:82 (+) Transcript_16369:437-682(+)
MRGYVAGSDSQYFCLSAQRIDDVDMCGKPTTLTPSTSAAELVGMAPPLEKKRVEIIVWLLLDRLRARWKEFMVDDDVGVSC